MKKQVYIPGFAPLCTRIDDIVDRPMLDYIEKRTRIVPLEELDHDQEVSRLREEIGRLQDLNGNTVPFDVYESLREETERLEHRCKALEAKLAAAQFHREMVRWGNSLDKFPSAKVKENQAADLEYLETKLGVNEERLEAAEAKIKSYECRFGAIYDCYSPTEEVLTHSTEPAPKTVVELLARPKETRFSGVSVAFTGDLRPYQKGLLRRVAGEHVRNMGGSPLTDDHGKKVGNFIVVGKDRQITDGKCKGITAITAEEFIRMIEE